MMSLVLSNQLLIDCVSTVPSELLGDRKSKRTSTATQIHDEEICVNFVTVSTEKVIEC